MWAQHRTGILALLASCKKKLLHEGKGSLQGMFLPTGVLGLFSVLKGGVKEATCTVATNTQ